MLFALGQITHAPAFILFSGYGKGCNFGLTGLPDALSIPKIDTPHFHIIGFIQGGSYEKNIQWLARPWFFGLLFVDSTLFDCSVSNVHLTFPKVESSAEMTPLHHGMTLAEVVESVGEPIYNWWVFINKSRQEFQVSEYAFYKYDQDESAGKKIHYRAVFLRTFDA